MLTLYAGMHTWASPGCGKVSSAFIDLFSKKGTAREYKKSPLVDETGRKRFISKGNV
jgi:hypothetical protein